MYINLLLSNQFILKNILSKNNFAIFVKFMKDNNDQKKKNGTFYKLILR